MLVHTVLFWLHKKLPGDKQTDFRIALETLKHIESARAVLIGSPADTPERPVIDKGYDYCLTVILKDVDAHNAYQQDPRHLDFLKNYSDCWKKVKVYDAD